MEAVQAARLKVSLEPGGSSHSWALCAAGWGYGKGHEPSRGAPPLMPPASARGQMAPDEAVASVESAEGEEGSTVAEETGQARGPRWWERLGVMPVHAAVPTDPLEYSGRAEVAKARIAQQTAQHHRTLLQLHVNGEL